MSHPSLQHPSRCTAAIKDPETLTDQPCERWFLRLMSCCCEPETAADEAGTEEAQPGPVWRVCALCSRASLELKWEEHAGWRDAPTGKPRPGRVPGCWNHPPSEPWHQHICAWNCEGKDQSSGRLTWATWKLSVASMHEIKNKIKQYKINTFWGGCCSQTFQNLNQGLKKSKIIIKKQ